VDRRPGQQGASGCASTGGSDCKRRAPESVEGGPRPRPATGHHIGSQCTMLVPPSSQRGIFTTQDCDAPGSWYCTGNYPPALRPLIEKRHGWARAARPFRPTPLSFAWGIPKCKFEN
jgi:hypothetical protein